MVEESNNGKNFAIQVLRGRYFMVFAMLIILSFAGTVYIFGLFSDDIKVSLGYQQRTLNLLSFFKDLGAYISIHTGLIREFIPPWLVLLIGAALNFFGYFMIWLSVTHRIPKPSICQMCMYICIGGNAMSFANNGTVVTCVKSFPDNRGIVIGVLMGYLSLGGVIVNQIYRVIHRGGVKANPNNSNSGIILLLSLLPTIVILAFVFTIRMHKVNDRQPKKEKTFFYHILYISLAMALFLMVINIVQAEVNFTKGLTIGNFLITMTLLFLPLVLVIKEEYKGLESKNPKAMVIKPSSSLPSKDPSSSKPLASPSEPTRRPNLIQKTFNPPPLGQDHTILQATFSLEMQLLHIASVCGTGGHITMINNLGQIGSSLGYPKSTIATFVSLVSIWQYLGRVLGGLVSDHLLTKYKCPRSTFLTLVLLFSTLSHLLIAFNVPNGIYIASSVIGFCLGAELTLLYTMISELFGLKNYSTLYNYATLGAPLGCYIFNVVIAGRMYDKEGLSQLEALGIQRKHGESLNCDGLKCFQMTFIILTVATLFSTVASLILVARTWKFYRNFRDNK